MDSATTLLQPVLMRTRGCPENNALWALRKAFADVCRQTECWRENIELTVSTVENVGTDEERVRIPDPAYSGRVLRVHRVLHERLNTTTATYDAPADISLESCRVKSGEHTWLTVRNRGILSAGDKLTLDVSLVPDEIGATLMELPPGIVKLCGKTAVDFAVMTLCNQPKRPWTDKETAALAAMGASNGIRRIMADIGGGLMDVPATSRPWGLVEG